MQHVRTLWAAVVLQARDDIDTGHYRSVEYGDAVAFFLDGGSWGQSRQAIADCLTLHPDDLTRLGRAAIAARHLRDGAPPVIVRNVEAGRPSLSARPVPRVTNPAPVRASVMVTPRGLSGSDTAATPTNPRIAKRDRTPRELRTRDWWIQRFMAKQAA